MKVCFVNIELLSTQYRFFLCHLLKTTAFLQLYTPPHPNANAIEPTPGISDRFNNGIGLKTLKPNEVYNTI